MNSSCRLIVLSTVILCIFAVLASCGPADGHRKLSDKDHYKDGHNTEFDHEAFLGKEQAKTFSELPPNEAKRRLVIIVEKIDSNKDGGITEEELTDWVRRVSRRYVFDDRDRHWDYIVKDGRKYVTWDEYVQHSYGMIEDRNKIYDKSRNLTYNEVIDRYERRFQIADADRNRKLDKDEYADFLHPHDVPSMQSVVIDETFQDMDKDRNGRVTLEEYLNDLQLSYSSDDNSWRERETEYFNTQRDKNGDGVLDKEEVGLWFYPPNTDPSVNEAKHLIYHADENKDHILSKAEILNQQDLFVGSQATEHGKLFVRHDEF